MFSGPFGCSRIPDEVFAQARNNKARIYEDAGHGTSGAERLRGDVLETLQHRPKFKIEPTEPFFAIGSCFARNLELHLSNVVKECITAACVFSDDLYQLKGFGSRNGALNAYTPGSMCALVEFASRPDSNRVGTLQVGDNEWADMMAAGLRFLNLDELSLVRSQLLDTYRRLSEARTVVITLGYTEAWRDVHDDIFVNRAPAGSAKLGRRASRYEFINMSVKQTIESLDQIVQSIHRQTSGQAKVIMTVSPVPLASTFEESDVVLANDYSKATLLCAASDVCARYDFVDYFPSYQYVRYSAASEAWESDGVHVRTPLVKRVVGRFAELYFN
jgi:hypothetical protein